MRALLFSDVPWIRELGRGVRIPANFADGESQEDYWKLQYLFTEPARRRPVANYDPELGWAGYAARGPRRPCSPDGRQVALLYGDSFAQCATPPKDCFPAILERSELGARFCMVNYGIGGYGLDQIYLMLRRTLDSYHGEAPIVIVGVLVDSDLDRSILSFRDWPKPRLIERGADLVLSEPVIEGTDAYLAEHPLEIGSYLLRYLAFSHRPLPLPELRRRCLQGDYQRIAEKTALNRRILHEIHREVTSRELRYFYLLFHMDHGLRQPPLVGWQEQLIRDTCADLGVPVISTRPYLLAAGCGDYETAGHFYGRDATLAGHHTALGNAVCFEALRHGLEGRFDESDLDYIARAIASGEFECSTTPSATRAPRGMAQSILGRPAWVTVRSASACVRHGESSQSLAERWNDTDRVCLRAGEWGATEVVFDLRGSARRLRATARSFTLPAGSCPAAQVRLVIEADGRTLFSAVHPFPADGVAVDLELCGVKRLKLMAQIESGPPDCDWVCLSNATIE